MGELFCSRWRRMDDFFIMNVHEGEVKIEIMVENNNPKTIL